MFIPGIYYILVYGNSTFSNATLVVKNATIPVARLELGVPATNITFVSGQIKYFTLFLPHDPIASVVAITVLGNIHMCVKRGQPASNSTKDYFGKEIHVYGPPFGKHIFNMCMITRAN